MVVPKKGKKAKGKTLEQLESESREEINQVDGKRQDIQTAINLKYLGTQFFFSVVFASEDEMRAYCVSKGIELRDGEYILARDYDISVQRRKK